MAAYGQRMAGMHQQMQSQQNPAGYVQGYGQGYSQGAGYGQAQRLPQEIDWGDPEHLQRVIPHYYGELRQAMETMWEMLRIQQDLNELRNEELYKHVNFTPQADPRALAQYMLEHKQHDVRKAFEGYRAPKREQEGYERGRREYEAEMRARGRTPDPVQISRDRPEGGSFRSRFLPHSEERKSEILDKISARTGIPRDDMPPTRMASTFSRPDSEMPSTESIPSERSSQPPAQEPNAA